VSAVPSPEQPSHGRGGGIVARVFAWSRPRTPTIPFAVLCALLSGGVAFSTSGRTIGPTAADYGYEVSNLTVREAPDPGARALLHPGATGDVVMAISNPNPYPGTVTAVQLPSDTTYATGYTTGALATAQAGCLASTPSDVIWNFSTATSGSSHALTSPLTVGASGQANNPLVVTFTDDASMTMSAPEACASSYFAMPSFTGITATGGAATSTTSPATDAWTS
jgi:hypothetical protein